MSLTVVKPVVITEALLDSSNVAENDAPAWAAGTYNTGATVIHGHHVWEALADGVTVEPGTETILPLKWLDLGATNRYRMFDKRAGNKWLIGKVTSNSGSIDVTIDPGQVVNAVGLVGVSGTSVRVIMTDPVEGVVYDATTTMAYTVVTNWYDYFLAPFEVRENLVLLNLPSYGTATVRVVVSAPNSTARVGMLVLGAANRIGDAVYGSAIGFENYSSNEIDDFGNETLTVRGFRDIVDFDVRIPTPQVSSVKRLLRSLKDTPALYVGEAGIDATIVIGRYEALNIVLSNAAISETSLEVRSLQ